MILNYNKLLRVLVQLAFSWPTEILQIGTWKENIIFENYPQTPQANGTLCANDISVTTNTYPLNSRDNK